MDEMTMDGVSKRDVCKKGREKKKKKKERKNERAVIIFCCCNVNVLESKQVWMNGYRMKLREDLGFQSEMSVKYNNKNSGHEQADKIHTDSIIHKRSVSRIR